MAEETEHTEPETPEPSHEGSEENRLHRLEEQMGEVLNFLRGGQGRAEAEPERPDIKAEVREAVREVQRQDKDKAEKAEAQKSLADQVAELKAQVEKPPFEYRRVTNVMGWAKPRPALTGVSAMPTAPRTATARLC